MMHTSSPFFILSPVDNCYTMYNRPADDCRACDNVVSTANKSVYRERTAAKTMSAIMTMVMISVIFVPVASNGSMFIVFGG